MRRTRVLLLLFVLIGTGLLAQSDNKTTTPVGNEPLLQQISLLKEQATKTNSAYTQLFAAATGSRSTYAIAVTGLNDACIAYIAELKKQSSSANDKAVNDALAREIVLVTKIQSDFCAARK
ncbi:MAG: hypothetical protein M3R17_12950 [Bacteroidota bacterium]|nr:hypothetical protein [Bacteroidota bacterium]